MCSLKPVIERNVTGDSSFYNAMCAYMRVCVCIYKSTVTLSRGERDQYTSGLARDSRSESILSRRHTFKIVNN